MAFLGLNLGAHQASRSLEALQLAPKLHPNSTRFGLVPKMHPEKGGSHPDPLKSTWAKFGRSLERCPRRAGVCVCTQRAGGAPFVHPWDLTRHFPTVPIPKRPHGPSPSKRAPPPKRAHGAHGPVELCSCRQSTERQYDGAYSFGETSLGSAGCAPA